MIRRLILLAALAAPAAAETTVFPAPEAETARLRVYSSLDARLAAPLVAAFQAQAPGVAVVYEDLLTGEIAARVVQETDAGAATADLILSSAMDQVVKLANDGYALPVDRPEAQGWPGWASWRDMAFALTFEPAVIVYYRPSFPAGPPDTRAALIEWLAGAPPGQIATYDIERAGVGYLFLARDREHFADIWTLVEAMGRAGVQVFPTSQEIIDRVADGRIALGYNILGPYAAEEAARRPTLGVALPADFAVVIARAALVPRAARDAALGADFLGFLLSAEGQEVLASRLRLPAVRPGVGGADSADAMLALYGERLRPVPMSPGLLAYLDQARRAAVLRRWHAALAGRD